MYLVNDQRLGSPYLVFTVQDPRVDDYKGEVIDDVDLEYDELNVHRWNDGQRSPEACVGVAPDDPKHFRVFKYSDELRAAGYRPVAGTPITFRTWLDYVNLSKKPPHPGIMSVEGWYDYLDSFDDIVREWRRTADSTPDQPEQKDRDSVAAWVARQHIIVDGGVREVWYLPEGAPSDEIRLLELNDRVLGDESSIEPFDYGLDVDGASFRLMVADVTTDQMDQIKKKAQPLPPGWTLDGNKVWRRRA